LLMRSYKVAAVHTVLAFAVTSTDQTRKAKQKYHSRLDAALSTNESIGLVSHSAIVSNSDITCCCIGHNRTLEIPSTIHVSSSINAAF